jgi:hypothetical protein
MDVRRLSPTILVSVKNLIKQPIGVNLRIHEVPVVRPELMSDSFLTRTAPQIADAWVFAEFETAMARGTRAL